MSEPVPLLKRGMIVRLTFAGRTVDAFVAIASQDGRSVGLMFDQNLGGYLGALMLSWDGEAFREVFFDHRAATIEVK